MSKISVFCIIALFFSACNAHARVIVKERTSFYTVSGKTGLKIHKSIRKKGPKIGKRRHVIATTTFKVNVSNVKIAVKRGRCVVTKANVRLSLHYRYPKLRNKKGHSKALQKAWSRFMNKLRAHEQKHGKIAKQLAKDIDKTVRRLSAKASRKCKSLGRSAKRKFRRLSAASNSRHARFDRKEARYSSRITRLERALILAR